ncbi:MAG: prepilin-type N-terminal cleavage/methylation domain-containing protein [Nitrospirae bacterium]|nr:prepilin-type N-terminal cleavage/methylation domain-containing protein [Nitrospirota bacterium]
MTKDRAFSLIELVIVIFIISLTTALIMPSFWDTGERALKSEAKRLSSTLRYVYDEAIGKKLTYKLKFNLSDDKWGFESEKESRSFEMARGVTFRDILIPSHGEISDGEVTVEFGPTGPDEPLTIHLIKGEKEYTVIFNHINGRTKILEGYIVKEEGKEQKDENRS